MSNHLTVDEGNMLNFYIDLHNQTSNRIDHLYNVLDELRENINYLTRNSRHRNRTRHRNGTPHNISRNNLYRYAAAAPSYYMPNEILNRPIFSSVIGRATGRTSDLGGGNGNGQAWDENVPIIPTTQQLERATREITFSEVASPLNLSCPISLERFEANTVVTEILHCHHLFNTPSLQLWFAGNVCCPMCRYDIRDYTTTPPREETTASPNVTANPNITSESNTATVDLLANITDNLLTQLLNNPSNIFGGHYLDTSNYNYDLSSNSITFFAEYPRNRYP